MTVTILATRKTSPCPTCDGLRHAETRHFKQWKAQNQTRSDGTVADYPKNAIEKCPTCKGDGVKLEEVVLTPDAIGAVSKATGTEIAIKIARLEAENSTRAELREELDRELDDRFARIATRLAKLESPATVRGPSEPPDVSKPKPGDRVSFGPAWGPEDGEDPDLASFQNLAREFLRGNLTLSEFGEEFRKLGG